ncbi:MAG: LuxR C-terminal-related transcriptional regulator [Propionibacteriaceae bacterium]|nr:LuxR C-terminal-related transcriptional regulator [Propionibacteriaceae bacterium]
MMAHSRDGLVEQLRALFARGQESASAVVAWLRGPEGIGKSTLAEKAAQGLSVRRVQLFPTDIDVPFSGALELCAQLGIDPPADNFAPALLHALEEAGPVTILIDDAQWLDTSSAHELWQVVRRFRRLPVSLIVTSVDASNPLLDGLGLLLRDPERGAIVTLEPFTSEAARDFIHEELGLTLTAAPLQDLMEVTGGYPVMLDAFTRMVRAAGRSLSIDAQLRKLASASAPGSAVPAYAHQTLNQSSESSRAALLAIAVAGSLTGEELAATLSRRGYLSDERSSLLRTGLVDSWADHGLKARHELARRAVIDQANWEEIRATHRALAQTLVGIRALEHEAASTDNPQEFLATLVGALVEAYAQRDYHVAFRLAKIGARLDQGWARQLLLVTLRMGHPAYLARFTETFENLPPSITRTAALAIISSEANPTESLRRLQSMGWETIEDPEDLMIVAHAALHIVAQGILLASSSLAALTSGFAGLPALLRQRSAAAHHPDLAIELLIGAVAVELVINSLFAPHLPTEQRIGTLRAMLGEAATNPVIAVMAPVLQAGLGALLANAGELDAAADLLQEITLQNAAALELHASCVATQLAFLDGRWDAAHEVADGQLGISLDALLPNHWQQSFAVAALVPACRDERATAQNYLGWQDASQMSTMADAYRRYTLAWAAVAGNENPQDVAGWLDDVWGSDLLSYTGGQHTGVLRVRAHLQAGDRAAAMRAREDVAALAYAEPVLAYLLAHCDALLNSSVEAFARAADLLQQHLQESPNAGLRLYRAVLAEDHAAWCLASQRPATAQLSSLMGEALSMLSTCGATAWQQRLDAQAIQLLPAQRIPDSSQREKLLASLTSREREIAMLVADGMSNREVAERLFVTVRTAEYHVHNALTKLGMKSRVELRRALSPE